MPGVGGAFEVVVDKGNDEGRLNPGIWVSRATRQLATSKLVPSWARRGLAGTIKAIWQGWCVASPGA